MTGERPTPGDRPPQPVPPDRGKEAPREEPPGSPSGPPLDRDTPPEGDPPSKEPPELV
ncbi:MAG TPA: hypothetical protein VFM29_06070 [Vicinamibacteria bacterium]|nr:hypothetical protein [Vicinamibacteria bacterium]